MDCCLNLDDQFAKAYVSQKRMEVLRDRMPEVHQALHEGSGPGNEYLGWLQLPEKTSDALLQEIQAHAQQVRDQCDCFILLGIGGSYLGARSAIEIQQGILASSANSAKNSQILYAGNHLSAPALTQLLNQLDDRSIALNVVSKSGSTLETSVAFQLLHDYMKKRYSPKELQQRIIVTTDPEQGSLRRLAKASGYQSYPVPENIGGRYSVLSPVGLFPMAVMGMNIQELLEGARQAQNDFNAPDNIASRYALLRNALDPQNIRIEALSTFEPSLHYLAEWWKQLFGESEGKEGKGLFPVSLNYTTDLHSLGQYLQEGQRQILETFLSIQKLPPSFTHLSNPQNGQSIEALNLIALQSTIKAHSEGQIPCIQLQLSEISPYTLGYLYYFFQKACAYSAYLLGVNPFNQPGVECYKKYMSR
jgi:glucose-6-phosphate isomerase